MEAHRLGSDCGLPLGAVMCGSLGSPVPPHLQQMWRPCLHQVALVRINLITQARSCAECLTLRRVCDDVISLLRRSQDFPKTKLEALRSLDPGLAVICTSL